MARNGSGTYNLHSSQPVTTGTAISSSDHNSTLTDIATALTDSVARNGEAPFTSDMPAGGNKITGLGAATARTDAASLANFQDQTGVYSATVGGTADVITITPSPAITAYVAGNRFSFIASGANTTNVTLNVSGLGAKAITKRGTTALAAGDIVSSSLVMVEYDGTQFQLLSPIGAALGDLATQNDSDDLALSGDNTFTGINDFTGATLAGGSPLVFEGATANDFETTLVITDPTADRTLTMPDADVDLTNVIQASATQTGYVELATEAEVETGTDTARVPSVATLRSGMLVHGTYTATTSGTSHTFSSIPSWVKKFSVFFVGVSTNGTSGVMLRLGDSGGVETTGYLSSTSTIVTGSGTAADNHTNGFILTTGGIGSAATNIRHGKFTFMLVDEATNTWNCSAMIGLSENAVTIHVGGTKALSDTLTQVELSTEGGSDTFDAGNWQIVYEG